MAGTATERVYVLLLNWNGAADTLECLETVFRNRYPSYRVIVCDNASHDGSVETIEAWARGEIVSDVEGPLGDLSRPPVPKPIPYVRYDRETAERGGTPGDPRLVLIDTGENLGFAGGCNVGIRYALARDDFDYVWLLNNDTAIEPDALTALVDRAREDPRIGMCGSTVPYYDRPHLLWALGGGTYNGWIAEPHNVRCREPRRAAEVEKATLSELEESLAFVVGASMLVSKAFLREIGLMREDYFLYCEELDWARRAKGHYRMGVAVDSVVYHKVGRSTGSIAVKTPGQRKAEYYAFANKLKITWRFYPEATPIAMPRAIVEYAVARAVDAARATWAEPRLSPSTARQRARKPGGPPLVSICMPTHNGARWLREALDSALAQTHPNFEVVVSDDASTDETEEIVRSYRDPRIRLARNKSALGLPGNWNRCIELAEGEYVHFLFQDDVFSPTCVARMVAVAEEDERVGLVFCRRKIHFEEPDTDAARHFLHHYAELHTGLLPLERINDGRVLLRRCVGPELHRNRIGEPTAVLVRRRSFERWGVFDARLKQIVDWEMWLRIMAHEAVGFVDEPLVTFRVHASSATAANTRAARDRYDKLWLFRSFAKNALPRLLLPRSP